MRCRKCRHRFFSTDSPTRRLDMERPAPTARTTSKRHHSSRRTGRLMRVIITVAVFGVMFLIFFAFLHYLSIEHPGEDNSCLHGEGNSLDCSSIG